MKSTDIERMKRELKKSQKKEEVLRRKTEKSGLTPGDYIKSLGELYIHDGNKIFNIEMDEKIQMMLIEIKESIEDKHWDGILRKSIKRTGIKEKEDAFQRLKKLLDES